MSELTEAAGRLARRAAWAPVSVLVAHSVGGFLFGHEPYVDPVMHFLGGVAAAYFTLQATTVAATIVGRLEPIGRDLLAFGVTCAAALCWEVAEFTGDQIRRTNVQRGLGNTMRDLILGASGGIVCLVLFRLFQGRRPTLR